MGHTAHLPRSVGAAAVISHRATLQPALDRLSASTLAQHHVQLLVLELAGAVVKPTQLELAGGVQEATS